MIRILGANQIGRLLARRAARFEEAEAVVRPILEAVRKRGDKAVLEYARKFDGFAGKSVRVHEKELQESCGKLHPEFREAAGVAIANIRRFAELQRPADLMQEIAPGQ